jgi:hypothetical protein
MIIIGRNYKGQIISIISVKSEELANAYWQGKDIHPHSSEVWDMNKVRENEEQGYVTPILTTAEISIFYNNSNHEFLTIK